MQHTIGTYPEPIIQQQPIADVGAHQWTEAVPDSPDTVSSKKNGNVFVTTVEVIVDGLQLEELKKSQGKGTTMNDEETTVTMDAVEEEEELVSMI